MRFKPIKKLGIAILVICLLFTGVFQSAGYAAPAAIKQGDQLTDSIHKASSYINEIMQKQYDAILEEIRGIADEKGYDYSLTMEIACEKGLPFKNFDYVTFLATWAALASDGKRIDLLDTEYISYEMEEESEESGVPYKIEEYEETASGLYRKTGFRYSTVPETVDVMEPDEENPGLYEKRGERYEEPEMREKKYGVVTFRVIGPEDLYRMTETEENSYEDLVSARIKVINKEVDNEEIRASGFLIFPELSPGEASWQEQFAENLRVLIGLNGLDAISPEDVVVAAASSLMGRIPYEWGGKASGPRYDESWWSYDSKNGSQKGLDCSGFVQWAYMTAGYPKEITAKLLSTGTILNSGYEEITEPELRPGDIGVIERRRVNHCGIYAGDGKWYHCSSAGNTVVLTDYGFKRFFRPGLMTYEKTEEENATEEETVRTEDKRTEEPRRHKILREREEKKQEEQDNSKEETVSENRQEEPETTVADQKPEKEGEVQEEPEVREPAAEENENRKEQETPKPTESDEDKTENTAVATAPAFIQADIATDSKKREEELKEYWDKIIQEYSLDEPPAVQVQAVTAYSESDVMLLAQIMTHEALSEGLNGWIAVGEVVMNRVASSKFPNTVEGVIFQKGQFTNAANIKGIKPSEDMLNTARGVMSGTMKVLNSPDVLFFRNPSSKGISASAAVNWGSHKYYCGINHHAFYLG